MALDDITREAVLAACSEYDELKKTRFLKKYGFRPSRNYQLYHQGKLYDSKAVVGAAHAYLGTNFEPLSSKAFSGGLGGAVRVLERLGFEVVAEPPPEQNPHWTRDELILATAFYRRHAPSIPGKTSRDLIALSDQVLAAAAAQGLTGKGDFRNPNGVYMKLMELRKYDPMYQGVGLGHERERQIEADVFAMSEDDLEAEARSVRARIRKFLDAGNEPRDARWSGPKTVTSEVLRELLASEDELERRLAETLIAWQDAKEERGLGRNMGREPGQIKRNGAVAVIEARVRSQASGFDLVTSTNQSYEQIVVDYPDKFKPDVVQLAKQRLAQFQEDADLAAPTDSREELDKKVAQLAKRSDLLDEPPAGSSLPRRAADTVMLFIRDPRVVAYTLKRADGICELCQAPAPFHKPDGTPYLEAHHIVPLADGGPDIVENCVAVCPNCHRAVHYAHNRRELAERLLSGSTISSDLNEVFDE